MACILCIDDDPRTLQVYKAVLESESHTVITATGGPAGIAMTRTHSLDLVILDFHMPGMNGGEVAALLKREQPNLPLAICSGYPSSIPEHLQGFADKILSKGDGPRSLLSAVATLIGEHSTLEKHSAHRQRSTIKRLLAKHHTPMNSESLSTFIQSSPVVHSVCQFCYRATGRDKAPACPKQERETGPHLVPEQPLVFVVDGDVMVADSTSLLLQHGGFEVFTFYDALPAAQKALLSVPDVVVTSYAMPLDGLVLAAWLREHCPCCKVVILSSNAEAVSERVTTGLKFTLLQKPVSPEKLISAVRLAA